MARPEVADGERGLQIWRVAANILNTQSRTADKGWSSSLGVGRGVQQSKEDEMGGACGAHGEVRGACNILVGKPEGRRPLGRPRRRWEDNIKMDLGEIGFGDVNWIHLAQDRGKWRALVNTVMSLRAP
jgi:hypothetical protein